MKLTSKTAKVFNGSYQTRNLYVRDKAITNAIINFKNELKEIIRTNLDNEVLIKIDEFIDKLMIDWKKKQEAPNSSQA